MILFFILTFLLTSVSFIFSALPTVTVLPWGIDEFLVSGMGQFRSLMEFFPPFATVLSAFLVYIGFRLTIILLRFFLGSNTPTHI